MGSQPQWGEIQIEDAALAGGFIQMPAAVVFDPNLSSGATITYGALLWHAWKHHRCPEQKAMATHLGVSLRTIQGHVAELEQAGYIRIIQHGLGRPNSYVIRSLEGLGRTPEGLSAHAPQPSADLACNPELDPQETAGLARNDLQVKSAEICASHVVEQDSTTQTEQQHPDPTTVVASSPAADTATANDVHGRMIALGVTASVAKILLRKHPYELLQRHVAFVEQRLLTGWVAQGSPAAYLVAAIKGDWAIPRWFKTPEEEAAELADRRRRSEAELVARQQAEESDRCEQEQERRRIEDELGIDEPTRVVWTGAKARLVDVAGLQWALATSYLLPLSGGTAVIAAGNRFFRARIEEHLPALRTVIAETAGRPIETVDVRLRRIDQPAAQA